METLLVKYVIPFKLIHQAKLKKKRTKKVKDRFCMGVLQHFLGKNHPLFKLNRLLYEEIFHFQ